MRSTRHLDGRSVAPPTLWAVTPGIPGAHCDGYARSSACRYPQIPEASSDGQWRVADHRGQQLRSTRPARFGWRGVCGGNATGFEPRGQGGRPRPTAGARSETSAISEARPPSKLPPAGKVAASTRTKPLMRLGLPAGKRLVSPRRRRGPRRGSPNPARGLLAASPGRRWGLPTTSRRRRIGRRRGAAPGTGRNRPRSPWSSDQGTAAHFAAGALFGPGQRRHDH